MERKLDKDKARVQKWAQVSTRIIIQNSKPFLKRHFELSTRCFFYAVELYPGAIFPPRKYSMIRDLDRA